MDPGEETIRACRFVTEMASVACAGVHSPDDGGHLEGVQISMVCIDGVQLEPGAWRLFCASWRSCVSALE